MAKTARKSSASKAIVDAESMAKNQREISISEFFAKNRHLLGFDNPRKALLTTVKEAVDNALDACEEAGILPDLFIGIQQISDTRFRITVRDNGPGIVRNQIEKIFGKLLYGSKFHRLKMSRGQQGIGIAAAGMYGLMTTGKPVIIRTKPGKKKDTHVVKLAIDTQKNRADVISDEAVDQDSPLAFPHETGTEVAIELEGRYQRGRTSVDEYLEQTAIANPHAQIIYQSPLVGRSTDGVSENDTGYTLEDALIDDMAHAEHLARTAEGTTSTPAGTIVFPRAVHELPIEAKEIQPHPEGIELGTLMKMLKTTESKQLGGFLQSEFCRVSLRVATELCEKANKLLGKDGTLTNRTWVSNLGHAEAEALFKAIQETKFMSPPTDCLSPIGDGIIRAGLLKGVKAEFYTSNSRSPAVYRGNPFQIEVGIAYGGELPSSEQARVIRFANRVPLLYQQSACCAYKAAVETNWRNYGLSQGRSALPEGPLLVLVHMASVWVPFTSESKEAIADYDEIRKEIKLAISECGRKLNTYIRRRKRMKREGERRGVFERYIREVAAAMHRIDAQFTEEELCEKFAVIAKMRTEEADMEFDEDGNPIRKKDAGNGRLDNDDSVIIISYDDDDDDEWDDTTPPDRSRDAARDDGEDVDEETLF